MQTTIRLAVLLTVSGSLCPALAMAMVPLSAYGAGALYAPRTT
jgi:hypothetical protein